MLLKNKIVVLLIFASPIIFLSFSKKEKEDTFYFKNIEKGMFLIPGAGWILIINAKTHLGASLQQFASKLKQTAFISLIMGRQKYIGNS